MKTVLIPLFLMFSANLVFGQDAASKPSIERPSENVIETTEAIVEKVFKVTEGEFASLSYQVTWRGQQVIVHDTFQQKECRIGDKLPFQVSKMTIGYPKFPGKTVKFLIFSVM